MTGAERKGYSLVELLVVTAIFAILATVLAQIFVAFNQLQRRVANAAVLGQDMRFATELLVREARNDEIDYTAYGGTIGAVDTVLKLKKQNGMSVWIGRRTTADSCDLTLTDSCLALSVNGGVTWSQITSGRVSVPAFSVFIRPSDSPFVSVSGSYPNDIQPFVTINTSLLYKTERPKERVTLQTQTTVSSRVYKR